MSTLLTNRLRECSDNDPTLEPLMAQWSFDKRLARKALQNVAVLYPHYSRHDESHSIQILLNIERVLGPERISRLSATDVWLLLESAYLHDIGMIVTKEEQIKDWNSSEFSEFLAKENNFNSTKDKTLVHNLAKINGEPITFPPDEHPLSFVSRISFILAEFYRRKHASRAAKITTEPEQTIGLSSPRTELIPHRLFGLLGEICQMHGKSRDELFKLPKVASGIGLDKVHPRFIASLLRIGDLLDLDNNRFCPVMLGIAGDVPTSTHAHIDKHHAVKHLRVDCERIEVLAECSSYQGYVECENWFEYLRAEIAWQMAHWADIVPSQDFGLLPTIGDIRTELRGFELVGTARPHFELDEQRVSELLQGAGLYSDPTDSLRELIQNAVDASLLHIWMRHGTTEESDLPQIEQISASDSPYSPHVQSILERYPIRINTNSVLNEDDVIAYEFEIIDLGVGISQDDIAAMARIGGSFSQTWKQKLADRMPQWMKPSGAFGIGLQSSFLLTDEITFASKSAVSGSELLIRMANPAGDEKGAIYVQKGTTSKYAKRPGTTLKFRVAASKIRTSRLRHEFFPEIRDPHSSAMPDLFSEICSALSLPVIINGELVSRTIHQLNWNYDSDRAVAVAIEFAERPSSPSVYFRGQHVRCDVCNVIPAVTAYANVFGSAKSVVNVARDRISSESTKAAIKDAIIKRALELYDLTSSRKEKALLSATLLALDSPNSEDYLDCRWVEVGGYSRNFTYPVAGKRATFPSVRTVLSSDISITQRYGDFEPRFLNLGRGSYSSVDSNLLVFLKAALHQGLYARACKVDSNGIDIKFSENDDDAMSIEDIAKSMLYNIQHDNLRHAFPTPKEFRRLSSIKSWSSTIAFNSRSPLFLGRNYMYSPFVIVNGKITISNFHSLLRFTLKNSIAPGLERDLIVNDYLKFAKAIDECLNTNEKWRDMNAFDLLELEGTRLNQSRGHLTLG